MANRAQVVSILKGPCRCTQSQMDLETRAIMTAYLGPKGGRGGGKGASVWEPEHIKNVLLGLAGLSSKEAPNAARQLNALVAHGDGHTLGSLVTGLIAAPHSDRFAGTFAAFQHVKWQITLCLDPLMAWGSNLDLDGNEQRLVYLPPEEWAKHDTDWEPEIRGSRRLTIIDTDVFLAARELWLGPEPSYENENAGLAGPASTRSNQDRRKTIRSSEADVKIERGLSQASPRGPGLSTKTSWRPNRAKSDRAPASRV